MNPSVTSENGRLIVSVFTAGGAFPVSGATVVIAGNDSNNQNVREVRISDISGRTEAIALPAPAASLSQVPGNNKPYATYNVEVTKDGYFRHLALNVPVFGGITSVQPAAMIPLPSYDADNAYPRNTNTLTEAEPNL